MSVTSIYSGVVVEQNALVEASVDLRETGDTVYQTFWLPTNYVMGSDDSELRVPPLSGLQVMVDIDPGYAATATLSYTLDYYINGSGWSNLTTGRAIGNHADGQCWMNLIFPQPVTIDATIAASQMRLGLSAPTTSFDVIDEAVTTVATDTYLVEGQTVYAHLLSEQPYPVNINSRDGFLFNDQGTVTFSAQQGVGALYYTESSLLAPAGELYGADSETVLIDAGASINFRVLALTADSGTSFLGNEYRSCVLQQTGDEGSFWMSTPQPSPFSVVSRYFDLRPNPTSLPFSSLNLVVNPSFEYDFPATTPYQWVTYDANTTRNNFSVVESWAYSGSQSLRSTNTFTTKSSATAGVATPGFGSQGIKVSANNVYSCGAVINLLSLPVGSQGLQVSVNWYNQLGTLISTVNGSTLTTLGEYDLVISNMTPPATAVFATLYFWAGTTANGVLDFEIDAVQFVQAASLSNYGDGDFPGWAWSAQRGRSPSGPLVASVTDEAQVVDGVLVDPATPNMAFNVYYSNDDANDSDTMDEDDWEGKLWTRVPAVYTCTQRQQYVFPEPVVARYIKLEFCNLNAQSYYPGTFPQPVVYKKMPTWVADYFITQLELPSFTANLVQVQDDALTLAYDYYLDDLSQSPNDPSLDPPTNAQLSSYFQQSDAARYVDADTLQQINLIMNSYQVPTGSIVDPTTLLGTAAQTLANSPTQGASLTAEVPATSITVSTAVSTLNREPVIFEQSMPVMYFFVTCRHGYKEVAANFDSNKAYFAGTNAIEFLRANYDVVSDQELYVESGSDTFNAFRNDFVIDDDDNWYTYG